jgi:hypothetical protein
MHQHKEFHMSYRTITRAVAGILVCVVPALAFAANPASAASTTMTAAQMRAMQTGKSVTKADESAAPQRTESASSVTKAAGLSTGLSNAEKKSESARKLGSH